LLVNNDATVARCDSVNENFSALHALCGSRPLAGRCSCATRPCRPAGVVSNCPKRIWRPPLNAALAAAKQPPAHVGAASVRRLDTLPSLNWLSAANPRRQRPITGSLPGNFPRPSGAASPSSPSTTRKHSSLSGRCVSPPPTAPPRHPQRGERWQKEKGRVTAALVVTTQTSATAMITQVSPTPIGFLTAAPLGSAGIPNAHIACAAPRQAIPSSIDTAAPTRPSKNGWSYGRTLPGTSSQCCWAGGADCVAAAAAHRAGCC
jgi:hypothetical protein